MSKYTTELRYICESAAGLSESVGFNSLEDRVEGGEVVQGVLSKAAESIFDFPYPIFDESYRIPLEKKILRRYYTREICEETVGLWKLRLSDRLNTIMPYYNQLYESELIKFNPLYDVNLTRSHSGRKDNEENNTSNSETVTSSNNVTNRNENAQSNLNTNKVATGKTDGVTGTAESTVQRDNSARLDKYADTPQGSVSGLLNDNYLTNARQINDTKDNSVVADGRTDVKQNTYNTEGGNENTESTANSNENSSGNVIGSGQAKSTNIVTGLESYIEQVTGKQGSGSMSKMLKEFRETFLNIDAMILEELSDLFFGLW